MDFEGRPVEWCILRDNPKLRRMMNMRAMEYGLNKLSKAAKIDYRNMYAFLKGTDCKKVTQSAVRKMCYFLKIRIILDFEIDDDL